MEAADPEVKSKSPTHSVSVSDSTKNDLESKPTSLLSDNTPHIAPDLQIQVPKVMTIDLPSKLQPSEPQQPEPHLEHRPTIESEAPDSFEKQPGISSELPNLDEITLIESDQILKPTTSLTDNGIFDFMTVDRAIELYTKIHTDCIPNLEWKFYGRRNPGDLEATEVTEAKQDTDEVPKNDDNQNQTSNTEFDFDEQFGELPSDTSTVGEKLQLKKRPEPGSEKKTNLSDIMSDILKESHAD